MLRAMAENIDSPIRQFPRDLAYSIGSENQSLISSLFQTGGKQGCRDAIYHVLYDSWVR